MKPLPRRFILLGWCAALFAASVLLLQACAPAMTPTTAPTAAPTIQPQLTAAPPTAVPPTNIVRPTVAPTRPPSSPTTVSQPTAMAGATTSEKPGVSETHAAPPSTSTPKTGPTATQQPYTTATTPVFTPTGVIEQRMIELEWPVSLHLGESDLIRLALVPYSEGYVVQAEFPEHPVQSQQVPVERLAGFTLSAVARLDGVGFVISPTGEQEQSLPVGETVSWRWTLTPRTAGQQRLSVTLWLRWTPDLDLPAPVRQVQIFSKGIDVRIRSVLGLDQGSAMAVGFFGLVASVGLGVAALMIRIRPGRSLLKAITPNPLLSLEPPPGVKLSQAEASLLQALFGRYARLILQSEFLSGYSGARTFLALPIQANDRSDALTIVKIGPRLDIQREFENYEEFVKDRLPPVTARIQHPPVTVVGSQQAALQYTFIGAPGSPPISLRQALLENPDPALLMNLFETFGPAWWMERRGCTFRLAEEYDCLLTPHYVIQPLPSRQRSLRILHETLSPAGINLQVGEMVYVGPFAHFERRANGASLTLFGKPQPGQPSLRLRWLSPVPPAHSAGRIVETRDTLLAGFTAGFERFGLPDPVLRLPEILKESVLGTQSTIHGDLNLENALVGPGGLVWLIDFAQTRPGHPLFDFAHLEAEIIAQVLAPRFTSPQDYLALLDAGDDPLLAALQDIYQRCLLNPAEQREANLARYMACMGALKFANLDRQQKHLLYLTAARISLEL